MAKSTSTETKEKLKELEDVFIITPIGDAGSETFSKANGLIESVIQPVLDELKMKAEAAHHIDNSGSINNQIISRIVNDKLVIVNLTGLNPNVMYELAIRHAVRKPVIIMVDKDVTPRLPFDIADQRAIFYSDTLAGCKSAKIELKKKIEAIDYDEQPDNPIYSAITQSNILQKVEDGDPTGLLLDKMDQILKNINDRPSNYKNLLNLGKAYKDLRFSVVFNGNDKSVNEEAVRNVISKLKSLNIASSFNWDTNMEGGYFIISNVTSSMGKTIEMMISSYGEFLLVIQMN